MNQDRMDDIIFTAELLTKLEISRVTLWRAIEAGQIPPPRRIGRKKYWDRRELAETLLSG